MLQSRPAHSTPGQVGQAKAGWGYQLDLELQIWHGLPNQYSFPWKKDRKQRPLLAERALSIGRGTREGGGQETS